MKEFISDYDSKELESMTSRKHGRKIGAHILNHKHEAEKGELK